MLLRKSLLVLCYEACIACCLGNLCWFYVMRPTLRVAKEISVGFMYVMRPILRVA